MSETIVKRIVHRLIFACGCLLTVGTISAQSGGVRGIVRNHDGQPLSYATLFLPEVGSGTVTNAEGQYEMRLPPGSYSLVFQHLGHTTSVQRITIGESLQELHVVLVAQPLELKTVDVVSGQEDLSYTVLRKAIAKASYHRQQVEHYSAQVYIKGSGRLKKAPFFLRKALEKEGLDANIAFATESVSRIEYQRPNRFIETVISVYTSGDANDSSPNGYINGSFYEPEIGQTISPLSPRAFAYYRFELEGYFLDRAYGVYKIRVIPRSRGENVFEGHLYIVQDEWSIHSLSLHTTKMGIGIQVEQVYAPIDGKAWLPVSHRFEVGAKVLGFDFEYHYLATVSDYQVTLNPSLDIDFTVIDEKVDQALAAELELRKKDAPTTGSIEDKLANAQEVTRRDLRQLMREYEREERKAQAEPEVLWIEEYNMDSMAANRDSLYWEAIRPVPLTALEVRGYQRQDSLRRVEESAASGETDDDGTNVVKRKNRKYDGFALPDLLLGGSYKIGKTRLSHESPLVRTRFNPVEGYAVSTRLSLSTTFAKEQRHRLSAYLVPRYAFARQTLTTMGGVSLRSRKDNSRSNTTIEGGRYIFQYHMDGGINELLNAQMNLVRHRNFISLYEKDFVRLHQQWSPHDNWLFAGGLEYARRYTLHNNTGQTWFPRHEGGYGANNPLNSEVSLPFADQETALVLHVGIEARPWQKYRIYNGRRRAIDGTSPTLTFHYGKGLPGLGGGEVDYDLVDVGIRHSWRMGAAGLWKVRAETGIFLNNKRPGFADFRHFQGNRLGITTSDPVGSYRLLDYYIHSTQDRYASIFAHYSFRKFLLTRIPEVWLVGIKENLFANYLTTPSSQNYLELGYSLDNILRLVRIEIVAGFRDGRYQQVRVLLGLSATIGNISVE